MARMRSLKPEFWLDRKLARLLSRDERMLYMGLWNQADEWGRANGDPRVIKGQVFPFDDDITDAVLETMLKALAGAGVVQLYEIEGDPFLFLPKLAEHQRLEPHKVPSRHPEPPELAADQQVHTDPQPRANESARDPGGAQTNLGEIRAKHVAGSREHVAGPRGADESAPSFDDFYTAYPRREARRKAEQAWRSALKRAPAQTILDGLRRFRFSEDRRYIPLPASWLNADRWADGQAAAPSPGGQLTVVALSKAEVDDVLGHDSWQLPPSPFDPETEWETHQTWNRETTEAHRAERVRLALAKLDRRVTT